MSKDNQDEVVRLLRKTSFDLVYKAMEDETIRRGSSGTNVANIQLILQEQGWTVDEFIKGLIQKMNKLTD